MIHAYTFDGTNIVFDVNSNQVHVVDEPSFNLIKDYETLAVNELKAKYGPVYGTAVVEEILEEIAELKDKGLLFSADPLAGGITLPEREPMVKALCLHLAHDCNLRCRYCFAGQGDFGGDRGLMPADVGRKALDLLLAASGSRRHVEVDFFGGEPLLNRPVMLELVDYGQVKAREAGKEIKFTLTTNTLLFDLDLQRFVGENNLAVVLSIDGRPGVHDRMRPTPAGKGSYGRVAERVVQFINSPYVGEHYVRGTFTRHNLDFSEDVRHLAELGCRKISVEPVVAGAGTDYALRDEDVPEIMLEYEKLTRFILENHQNGNPIDFFHFNVELEEGPCLAKRLTGCSAGLEYLAVSPQGDLYPCHQFVGRDEYKMGTVFNGAVDKKTAYLFAKAHIYNKNACKNCWAKFNCSGGCHANALAFNNSLLEPYRLGCILARKRLECALYLKVMLNKSYT
ncbi:thioether cross-link-forming SCIFF peptide maturase [Desulfotruncus alcoholivorax]|uniref:thioether cross-link-forming SCIFF peptide maturase n=1 Tax=Desulfotruncus alcoholivorax TaxID=265477 RepID=UPI0003F513D4|nr:thioether cross-link-forming SCIFF peptide maturase [Desulfotruncus alcoholivorax]